MIYKQGIWKMLLNEQWLQAHDFVPGASSQNSSPTVAETTSQKIESIGT